MITHRIPRERDAQDLPADPEQDPPAESEEGEEKEDEEEEGESSDEASDFEAGEGVVRLGLRDMDKLDTGAVGHGVSASHSEEEEDSLADTEPMPTDDDLNSDANAPQTLGEP